MIVIPQELEQYFKGITDYVIDIKFYAPTRLNAKKKSVKNILINVSGLKDYFKQKNSGIDRVFCKLVKENNKRVFFNLNEVLESKNPEILIARIRQNIVLLKKHKVNYEFVYFCKTKQDIISDHDIKAFLRVLESKL